MLNFSNSPTGNDSTIAFFNGRIIPNSQAALPFSDLGMQGLSVTEMLRTYGKQLFRVDEHLERLKNSVEAVGFEMPMDIDSLVPILDGLVLQNSKALSEAQDLGLVIFVTAGANSTYLGSQSLAEIEDSNLVSIPGRCSVGAHTFPLQLKSWKPAWQNGIHLVIPEMRQIPISIMDPKIKSRSRMHWYLADQQAKQIAPDARSILLDENDHLTETSTANFFIVKDRVIMTPKKENVLAGVSRSMIFDLAEDLSIKIEETNINANDVLDADEAFVTSTPYSLIAVTKFENQVIGDGKPGPVCGDVVDAWSRAVKFDLHQQMLGLK